MRPMVSAALNNQCGARIHVHELSLRILALLPNVIHACTVAVGIGASKNQGGFCCGRTNNS